MKISKLGQIIRDKNKRHQYSYSYYDRLFKREMPRGLAGTIKRNNAKDYAQNGNPTIVLNTYDNSGQVVHPDVIYWNDEYWMAVTPYPYTCERYENPCIYHGDSLFRMDPIGANPLALPEFNDKRNHLSDPCLFIHKNRINVIFRDTVNQGGRAEVQNLYICSSEDGFSWSEKKLLFSSEEESYISPAVLIGDDSILLYYVDLKCETGGDIIVCKLDEDFNILEKAAVSVDNGPEGLIIWHFGIMTGSGSGKDINGDPLRAVITFRSLSDPNSYYNYFAESDTSYTHWTVDNEVPVPEYLKQQIDIVYKCSLVPRINDVLMSFRDTEKRWRLCVLPGLNDLVDNKDIVDSYRVFSRVFQSPMSLDKFIYKHCSNPYKLPYYYAHIKSGRKLIATNCFLGAKMKYGDKRYIAAQSCDTAVVPENRGGGVFMRMISEATENLKSEQVDFMFGFPNSKSYGGFMKLGWKDICTYNSFLKICSPKDIIIERLGRRVTTDSLKTAFTDESVFSNYENAVKKLPDTSIDTQLGKKCPFSDRDISVINSSDNIKIERTVEYFKWKTDNNSDRFYYLTARENDDLTGYIIFELSTHGRIKVIDWFAVSYENGVFDYMLDIIEKTCNSVVVPMIRKNSAEEQCLFKKNYYKCTKKPFLFESIKLIVDPLNIDKKEEEIILNADNWFITPMDWDTTVI